MKKLFLILFVISTLNLVAQLGLAQKLPYCYDELTAPDFIKAVKQSEGVCLLPIGILEKHGPHLPLGTDIFECRKVATTAAEKEYSVVFPTYYFGQINEARHQPGVIAYSPDLIWKMLQETCDELSRNGLKKIIIVNGHGGNNDFLRYFCMSQLHTPKDYVLIFFQPKDSPETEKKIEALRKTTTGGHADEMETSMMRYIRPELVKVDQAGTQSGKNQARLAEIPNQYTGIWWYAQYPNHYAGDATKSSVELGKLITDSEADQLVQLIKKVKQSNKIEELQNQFYKESANPLNTKQ
jgi:creatinine amidohydrolase